MGSDSSPVTQVKVFESDTCNATEIEVFLRRMWGTKGYAPSAERSGRIDLESFQRNRPALFRWCQSRNLAAALAVASPFSFGRMRCSQLAGGVSYADASLHGSNDDVHHGDGTEFARGSAHQSSHDRRSSRRQHHGLRSAGEYHAVRRVHVAREPDGCRRNRRRDGRPYPHALHSRHDRSVGSRSSDCDAR
jgi:hypothetical protein